MKFVLADDFLDKLAELEAMDPELAELLRSKLALMRQACESSSTPEEMEEALARVGIERADERGYWIADDGEPPP